MRQLVRTILIGLSVVFLSHLITFSLTDVLPDAANLVLGIESSKEDVFKAFKEAHKQRNYQETLSDLLHGKLGTTLDGVNVNTELSSAIKASLPRLIIAVSFVIFSCIAVAFIPWKLSDFFLKGLGLITFLPPYVFPFVVITIMVGLGKAGTIGSNLANHVLIGITIAISPAAYTMTQTIEIVNKNCESIHGRTLVAMGAKSFSQRWRLINNLIVEIVPSLEKTLIGAVAVLLFAEPILGVSGFGTMTLRAIRRSDTDLILASVIILSVIVSVTRVASTGIRLFYNIEE